MKTSKAFDTRRFLLLAKLSLIHNRKSIPVALLGLCAGIFVLLVSYQIVKQFEPWVVEEFFFLFFFLFAILAVIYTGSSFPGLRSKEKNYNYLLIPASTLEKFWFEFISRVILFLILMPVIFWVVFYLEGIFIQLMYPGYIFKSFSYLDFPLFHQPHVTPEMHVFNISSGLLFLSVSFAGSTSFMKHPILKTLGYAAGILFLHLVLLYFYAKTGGRIRVNFAIYFILLNIAMIGLAYLKLKRREA